MQLCQFGLLHLPLGNPRNNQYKKRTSIIYFYQSFNDIGINTGGYKF